MRDYNITSSTTFVNWSWEFLQTLLGWLCKNVLYKVEKVETFRDTKVVYLSNARIGVSLGRYILMHKSFRQLTKLHEWGHTRQSKLLGPFYLFVVGLPSITLNILSRGIGGQFRANYYNRFPENWADQLAGIERK